MTRKKSEPIEFNVGDGYDDARRYNAEHKQEYTKLGKELRKAYQEYCRTWDGGEWTPPNGVFFWRKYVPEDYPKIDNYDAIEVSHTWETPSDYVGIMFVPITFLDLCSMYRYYFEIVDELGRGGCINDALLHGKKKFKRIAIKWQPWCMCPEDYGVSEKEWLAMCGWDDERIAELEASFSNMSAKVS